MGIELFNNAEIYENAYQSLKGIIESDKPYWINRIGGSDFDVINNIFIRGGNIDSGIANNKRICQYNGYYDLSNDKIKNFNKYYELYLESLKHTDITSVGNAKLLTHLGLFTGGVAKHHLLVDKYKLKYCTYSFIEEGIFTQNSFLNRFAANFSNKKILLISPFGKIMKEQYEKHGDELYNCEFPLKNVIFDYIHVPITYNNGNSETYLPHNNMLETLEYLQKQIDEKDFDIAFLSCGIYANLLGPHIKIYKKRSAIYIGGILQTVFGIKGNRYNRYVNIKPNKYWINPPLDLLNSDQLKLHDRGLTEHVGAYFIL